MADIIGKIEGLEGSFFAKDSQGNLRKLQNGDEVYEGETIIPDTNNVPSAILSIIPVDGTPPLKIDSTQEQILDKTLLNEGLNNEELAFNPDDIQDSLLLNNQNSQDEEPQTAQFAQLDGAKTDVNSDLRKKEFDNTQKEPLKEDNNELEQTGKFATLDGATTYVNSDLRQRAFGAEENQNPDNNDETTQGKFTALDGARTDVNSDLRDASWPGIMEYTQIQNNEVDGTTIGSGSGATFAPRDGASTDVVSDLRQAQWFEPVEEPTYDGDVDIPADPTPTIPINYIPTAVDDPRVIVKEGGASVTGQLLTNDIKGGDGLVTGKELKEFTYNNNTYTFDDANPTYTINGTTLGDLTVNRDGTWELVPGSNIITGQEEDNFTYKIVDTNGDISNSATQPFIMWDSTFATNIMTTTTEDTEKVIFINDIGGDVVITDTSSTTQKTLGTNESINITRADTEIVGTVTNNGNGTVTFTPSEHYCGDDAVFGYEVTRSDNTTIINDSVTVTVTPTAETDTTDTDNDSHNDVITQGDKTYTSIDESATYSYIPLTGLNVTNEDDRGNGTNPFASEITTVKLSGVPVGFKFLYNDGADNELTVTDVNDGVTIPFEYISTLQIKPTDFFAGEIKVKMEVITVDCETGAPADQDTAISSPDYLIINVKNVANGVDALNAAQATGDEDIGRANGNTSNDSNPETITAPENGITLDIDATLTDTSGREKVTTIIDEIPDGGALYYSDANGTITVDKSGVVSGSNSNVTVTDNADNTFKVTIADFKNDAPLKFIPPHNSNDDYDFKVTAFTTDGDSISSSTAPKTMNVVVDGVADIPVHDDFKKLDSNETVNTDVAKNIYSDVVIEDNSNTRSGATISFKDLYKEAGLDSYDSDSETLSVIITNLNSSISVQDVTGISFNGASGTSREWSFNVSDLDKVVLQTSKNFSGDFSFKVKHITTEDDGDSKIFEKDVSILVKPLVEANITTSASAKEDEVSQVSFAIKHQNGDTNETLDTLWINKADVTGKDFTLYSDNTGSTVLTGNGGTIIDDGTYYKLTGDAITSVYIKYSTDIGSSNTSDSSFGIKYTVSDSATASNGDVFTSTNEETSSVYNISLLSVTDTISVDTSNGTSANNIVYDDGASSVTINEVGTFSFDVDVTSTDTDDSENFTRIVIENVQRGITIDDQYATMAISGGDTNIWFLDIPTQELTNGTSSYTVNFAVDSSLQYSADTSTVKITTYAHDTGANTDDIQEASLNIEFINNLHTVAGDPSPTIDVDMSINTITVTEDTQFVLDGIIDISLPTGGVNDAIADTESVTYTLAFSDLTNVSFDIENDSYTNSKVNSYNGEYYITVTAAKSDIQTSIETELAKIKMIGDDNYNENNAVSQLSFDVKLTAYTGAGHERDTTADMPFSVDVVPVTDDITSSVTQAHVDEDTNVVTNAQEDGTTTLNITFDTVDNPDYTIVQGATNSADATTITITHTSGIYGTLTWTGGTYTFNGTDKVALVDITKINDGSLKFTPTDDASGNSKFSYTVYAQETGSSIISETSKEFTISVSAVADGLNLPDLSGSGDEDTYIQIYADETNSTPLSGATQIDNDSSETIKSMFIDGVPEGFLLYIGESGSQTLATKGSKDATQVTIDGTDYDTYKWTINISDGIPKVWIKAPEGWSSTTDVALTLDTLVKDGSDYTNVLKDFTVTVNSVVDGFDSVTPNNTVQTASADVDINLNAQAGDLDGSETGILTLTGLGAGATFKQDGDDISANVVYDNTGGIDTYTISNIDLSTDKLNKLTFQQGGLTNKEISYTFKTEETDDSEQSAVLSGTFNATTDNVITNIATAGTAGTDRLELGSGGINFDTISSTSIEKIDLTNADVAITNVTMQDVLDMTDGDNELIIIADDSGDSVQLTDDGGNTWVKGSDIDYGDQTFETYTNGDATVKVSVDENSASIVTIA